MRTHLLALPRGFAPLGLVGARMLIDADPAPRPPVVARAPAPEMQPPAPPPASPQTAQPTPKPVATVAPKPVEPVVKIEPLEPIPVAPIEIVAPAMPIPAPIPIEIAPVIEATSPPTPPPLVPTPMPAVVSSAAAWKPWIEITPANAAREEPSPAAKVAEGNLRFIALLLLATVSLIATGALFRRRGVPASPRAEPSFTNGPGDGERAIALRTKAEGQVALINRALAQLTTVAPLRNALARDLQASERRLAAVVAGSASTASADGMGRARRRLERIAQDLDRLQQIADSAISSMSGMRAGVELPRNKHEAYATLGVTPGVSDAILKKLVEALRISWHPDLGSTDEERAARNIRITEINVAWDLITGKRQSE